MVVHVGFHYHHHDRDDDSRHRWSKSLVTASSATIAMFILPLAQREQSRAPEPTGVAISVTSMAFGNRGNKLSITNGSELQRTVPISHDLNFGKRSGLGQDLASKAR